MLQATRNTLLTCPVNVRINSPLSASQRNTSPVEPVKIYDSSVDVQHMDKESAYALNVQYRTGDVLVPKLDGREALSQVAVSFAARCLHGTRSASEGDAPSG